MNFVHQIGHALYMAFGMFWEILWALNLGFALSAIAQAVVSKRKVSKVLGDDKPATIALACGLGAASSSCSYAAVALARSLFRKGASFTAATLMTATTPKPRRSSPMSTAKLSSKHLSQVSSRSCRKARAGVDGRRRNP